MNLTEKIERKIMPNLETAMIEISDWKKIRKKLFLQMVVLTCSMPGMLTLSQNLLIMVPN